MGKTMPLLFFGLSRRVYICLTCFKIKGSNVFGCYFLIFGRKRVGEGGWWGKHRLRMWREMAMAFFGGAFVGEGEVGGGFCR